jgi:integrase
MASIWKPKDSKNWCAKFLAPDGKYRNKTTGTTDKAIAMKFALELELFSKQSNNASKARKLVDTLIELSTGKPVTRYTIKSWLEQWLENKDRSRTKSTYMAYRTTVSNFIQFLGLDSEKKDLEWLEPTTVNAWLNELMKQVTPNTAGNHLKRLSLAFSEAVKFRYLKENPCSPISAPTESHRPEKEIFTRGQVESLLKIADKEWKGVILLGIYCGLRIGDAATLRWKDVDLDENWISLTPEKTRRLEKKIRIHIHPELHDHFMSLDGSDDPEAFLQPNLAEKQVGGKSGLSLAFSRLVAKAGIKSRLLRPQKSTETTTRRHKVRSLTFHSLRHTANSWLANEGVPEELRMKILGHSDKSIHAKYTHHDEKALREAIAKLPRLNNLT